MPYEDRDQAARVVTGELPDFPHLPELPERGVGSDMIGRTAALLVGIHVDLQPSGWRVIDRPGRDERRAESMLRADLDAFEIAAHGVATPVKIQVTGPLTLAAMLDRSRGDKLLADHGARRDLAESLAEGVRAHVADVAQRLPAATVVVQVDEPSLPAVLDGAVPTISGFGRLRSVHADEAEALLSTVLDAAGASPVVHCCAAGVPASLLRRAGAAAVSLDIDRLDDDAARDLAAAVDAGLALWPGVVPATTPAGPVTDRAVAERVTRLWRRLDQDPAVMTERTVITPACGLARADVGWARSAMTLTRNAAHVFAEMAGGS